MRERKKENEAAKAKVNAAREAFEATLKTSLSEKIKAANNYVKKNWDLYFITHIDNLQHITKDGIVASKDRPKNYRNIAKKSITLVRDKNQIKPGLSLSNCAHVYFRPDNAMLAAVLKWKTQNSASSNSYIQHRLDEIVIIRINIDLTEHELYMVEQNAYHKHQPEDFIPSYRYMEIIPKIEKMLKETGWHNRPNEEELKRQFMAECHISKKFPLDSLKAICIADERSIKNKRYNFGEFYDNVKSRISRESVLTEKNIEQRRDLFFEGRYG